MRLSKTRRKLQRIKAAFWRLIGCDCYKCGCGHTATWNTKLKVFDHEVRCELPSSKPKWCPQCIAKAAIKCAWCGDVILPGDPITLYTPRDPNFQIREHAAVYKREPHLQLVGCLGMGCCECGADRSGFWKMPGEVQRVMSPIEMLIASGGTEPMIFNDLSDPSQAIPIVDEASVS